MLLFFYLSISHLFIATLCYQMIYVDSLGDNKELENISCSWRYFCDENFNFCEYGCSSKKKLKKGYNLLNTSTLSEKCFVNIECDNYDMYFDSENLIYFIYFSKFFFLINPDFTLYINLLKRTNIKGDKDSASRNEHNNSNEKNRHNKNKKTLNIFQKLNYYRNLITKKFKKNLIKLLIFFILIHMIFFYLYIYTYLSLKKYDKMKQNI
ncbi:conserved Plasmodium protein, unknown function [Plasmodium relictum]|uniref:Uncharacterized protein n=1 Tax=Plasmodium relictum TaxID=85471 RepID=A0A1J1H807_PLARL|nr:conserved Plasmodium protein, unknown function [Plasmodium relictum]CRH00918.1 conserved Plasmodium protein, unknown function [Plasmodium relictum]